MDMPEYPLRRTESGSWNEVAPIHRQHWKIDLRQAVQSDSFSVLSDIEREVRPTLGPSKVHAQLAATTAQLLRAEAEAKNGTASTSLTR